MRTVEDHQTIGVISLIIASMFFLCSVGIVETTDIFTLLSTYSTILVISLIVSYVAAGVSMFQSVRIFEMTKSTDVPTMLMFACATGILAFVHIWFVLGI